MKAIIENSLIFMEDNERNHNMLIIFTYILHIITKSLTEDEIRKNMVNIIPYPSNRYFKWGFGSNHMWLHQKRVTSDTAIIDETKRILIVEF